MIPRVLLNRVSWKELLNGLENLGRETGKNHTCNPGNRIHPISFPLKIDTKDTRVAKKEQIRYIVKVYPEKISQERAKVEFMKANLDPIDQSYWQKTADVVNEIANSKD